MLPLLENEIILRYYKVNQEASYRTRNIILKDKNN
jgi:hypothetical protein